MAVPVPPLLHRISSFSRLPFKSGLNSLRLAHLGFMYVPDRHGIICQFCANELKISDMMEFESHYYRCSVNKGKVATVETTVMKSDKSGRDRLAPDATEEFYDCKDTFLDSAEDKSDADFVDSRSAASSSLSFQELCSRSDLLAGVVERSKKSVTKTNPKSVDFELLKSNVLLRLRTFSEWPAQSPVNPVDLAKSGFYYTGKEDKVQCVYCKGAVNHWVPGDIPEKEHSRHFPNCPRNLERITEKAQSWVAWDLFLQNLNFAHVAAFHLYFTKLKNLDSRSQGQSAGAETEVALCLTDNDDDDEDKDLYIDNTRAKMPKYSRFYKRVESFKDKPVAIGKTPQQLASAGFYHSGPFDNVRCFYCDIGLKNWREEDEPWKEHARWSSQCKFLHKYKSEKFIRSSQSSRPQANKPAESSAPAVQIVTAETTAKSSASRSAASEGLRGAEAAAVIVVAETETVNNVREQRNKKPMNRAEAAEAARSRLDTPQAEAMVNIGFSKQLILQAFQRRFQTVGEDFEDNSQLFDAIIEIEAEMKQQQKVKSKNKRGTASTAARNSPQPSKTKASAAAASEIAVTSAAGSSSAAAATATIAAASGPAASGLGSAAASSSSSAAASASAAAASAARGSRSRSSSESSSSSEASTSTTTASATVSATFSSATQSSVETETTVTSRLMGAVARVGGALSSRARAAGGVDQINENTGENTGVWNTKQNKKNKKSKKKNEGSNERLTATKSSSSLVPSSSSSSRRASNRGATNDPAASSPRDTQKTGKTREAAATKDEDIENNTKSINDDDDDEINDVIDTQASQDYKREDLEKLVEEYRNRLDDFTCRICMDRDRDTVIMPCGHLVSCSQCAAQLKSCPMCRRTVRGTVKTYLS